MYWIVQNNIYSEEGHQKLLDALSRLDLPHSLHKCIPFIGALEPEIIPPPGKVFVMGSYTLMNQARLRGWSPGGFTENLDFETQLSRWGEKMLNHDANIFSFSSLPPQLNPFFIRPTEDTKSFIGQIMDWPSFEEWREQVLSLSSEDGFQLNKDTQIMVAPKKEIFKEVRTWVVNGRVVTSSIYKIGTIRMKSPLDSNWVDPSIVEFVHELGWYPNPACVIDVGETEEGYKIIEVNNLNSSGFYAGDMNKLVGSLEESFG